MHHSETVRSDEAYPVLAYFGVELLFKQAARLVHFGEPCRNKNRGRDLLGGAIVDDGEDELRWNGDDGEVDRIGNGSKRRKSTQAGDLSSVGIDGED